MNTQAPKNATLTWKSTVPVAAVFAAAGIVWGAAVACTTLRDDVKAHNDAVEDHEVRLRALETDVGQIATDVGWIRHALESERGGE